MSTSAPQGRSWVQRFFKPGFNIHMAYACVAILLVSVLGCLLTSTHVSDPGILALGLGAAIVVALPVILYLQGKEKFYLRDSVLTVLWALFFTLMLGFPVTVAARLVIGIPLQDEHFVVWDRWLGVNVTSIAAWASNHWQGNLINKTYPMLFPFMKLSILLPILTGKVKYAQKFLTANLVAFSLGLPVFALLPGVGPWFGFHLSARPDQAYCEALVLLIRQPGPYLYRYPSGVICFPSFHVVWAILCVHALWGFRLLRIPVSLFAALIVLSTLSTGNHYLCDVLAGFVLAVVTIVITERLSRRLAQAGPSPVEMSQRPLPE